MLARKAVKSASAEAELRSYLTATAPRDVAPFQIATIFRRHRLGEQHRHQLSEKLWRDAPAIFAADEMLSEDEYAFLADLKHLLEISDDVVRRAEIEIAA